MREQGIMNFCVESRPHPDFLGNGWWATLDFLIAEAKKYEMKMWILDDAKFPTGYANGKVPQQYRKRYLDYRRYDIAGKGRVELDAVSYTHLDVYKRQLQTFTLGFFIKTMIYDSRYRISSCNKKQVQS